MRWKSLCKTTSCIGRLARRYNLSGGEIDNIVRKSLMEEVLKGSRPDVNTISEWCNEEKLKQDESRAIGYVA